MLQLRQPKSACFVPSASHLRSVRDNPLTSIYTVRHQSPRHHLDLLLRRDTARHFATWCIYLGQAPPLLHYHLPLSPTVPKHVSATKSDQEKNTSARACTFPSQISVSILSDLRLPQYTILRNISCRVYEYHRFPKRTSPLHPLLRKLLIPAKHRTPTLSCSRHLVYCEWPSPKMTFNAASVADFDYILYPVLGPRP